MSIPFSRQWNPKNQSFSCRTDTFSKGEFSVHSKIFAINDMRQIITLVSGHRWYKIKVIPKSFKNLLR